MSASRFRKKPVIIEAMPMAAPFARLADWCPELKLIKAASGRTVSFGVIHTLEGDMRADLGDWIIRGVQGEFYPCKPDIFEATYEPVDESASFPTK